MGKLGRPPAWWLEVEAPPGTDPECTARVRAAVEGANGGHPLADPRLATMVARAAAARWGMAAESSLSAAMVMTVKLSRRLPASAGRALGIRGV